MFGLTLFALSWTAQAFNDKQQLALICAGLKFLRSRRKGNTTGFRNENLEGQLTRKGPGNIGGISGTQFHADCGLVSGERWTMDFIIPTYAERTIIDEESTVLCSSFTPISEKEMAIKSRVVQRGKSDTTRYGETLH